jgi:hypothetical protein
MTDTWPKHPDGRNKKMGELTAGEQKEVFRRACLKLKAEFEHPLVQEKIAAILRDEHVNH